MLNIITKRFSFFLFIFLQVSYRFKASLKWFSTENGVIKMIHLLLLRTIFFSFHTFIALPNPQFHNLKWLGFDTSSDTTYDSFVLGPLWKDKSNLGPLVTSLCLIFPPEDMYVVWSLPFYPSHGIRSVRLSNKCLRHNLVIVFPTSLWFIGRFIGFCIYFIEFLRFYLFFIWYRQNLYNKSQCILMHANLGNAVEGIQGVKGVIKYLVIQIRSLKQIFWFKIYRFSQRKFWKRVSIMNICKNV